MRRSIVFAAVVLVGAACTNDGDASVDWSKYAPAVQQRIDRLAADGNCTGLQDEFDTADTNDAATRARTGEGNADLLAYIDEKLSDAGCYD